MNLASGGETEVGLSVEESFDARHIGVESVPVEVESLDGVGNVGSTLALPDVGESGIEENVARIVGNERDLKRTTANQE